jgi:hypothetical protein
MEKQMSSLKAKLSARIRSELAKIPRMEDLLRGSLVKVATRCGNKNCRCAIGKKHVAYHLTFKNERGVTRTVYVRKNKVADVKMSLKNYKAVKKIIGKAINMNLGKLKCP